MIDKIKQLTKETAIYGVSTIVSRFLNFMLVPLYTHFFSPGEAGVYANVYAYIAFFQILVVYGMDAAYLKFGSIDKEEKRGSVFPTAFNSIFLTSILICAVLFAVKSDVSVFIDLPQNYFHITDYVILILFFDAVTNIPFVNLRLNRRPLKFAVIRTLNIALNLSLNIILIIGYDFGIEAIFISNLAASILSLVLLLPEIFKNLRLTINLPDLKKMLRFGLPYLPASFTAIIIRVIDRPLLTSMTDEATVGIYSMNYKLGIFMMLFVSMFQFAWQPFFLDNAKDENAKGMFARVLTLFLITSVTIWVVLSVFIQDIVTTPIPFVKGSIIAEEFWSGIYIVPVILLGYVFNGLYVNFTAGIFIEEKTKYMPLITGLGAATNIGLNFLLIPVWNILGAAVAMLLSYVVMAAAIFIVSQKFYRIKYETRKILMIFLSMVLIGSSYYYLDILGLLNIYYKFLLLFGYIILLFGLRVLNLSEIKKSINLLAGNNPQS